MLKRLAGILSIVLVMTVSAFPLQALAAEGEELELETDLAYYTQLKGKNVSINVYNWGEYISNGEDDMLDVNRAFQEVTGIKVNYSTYATNEELYSKLRSGGAQYDVIIPSDYMIGRMVTEGMLEPLNFDNIPNFAFIDDNFIGQPYDPDNLYSVPYTWGVVGIIYNTDMVDVEEVTSWDILWDQKYMGDILMFSNPRDAFAIAQSKLGYSLNTSNERELRECLELLQEQKLLVQAYVMDEIFDKMLGGEAALAPYYAGDAYTMMEENEVLGFAVPEEGTNIFIDAMCIPKGSKNKLAAELYINFMCEPEVSAANGEYIGYALPNPTAVELLDEEMQQSPVAYPPQEIIDNAEYFNELPREANLLMDQLWTELLSSDAKYNRMVIPTFLVMAILLSIAINVYRHQKKKRSKNYF